MAKDSPEAIFRKNFTSKGFLIHVRKGFGTLFLNPFSECSSVKASFLPGRSRDYLLRLRYQLFGTILFQKEILVYKRRAISVYIVCQYGISPMAVSEAQRNDGTNSALIFYVSCYGNSLIFGCSPRSITIAFALCPKKKQSLPIKLAVAISTIC